MKRALIILNANCPESGSIRFACQLAQLHGARLSGLLAESMLAEPKHSIPTALAPAGSTETGTAPLFMDAEQGLGFFHAECARWGVEAEGSVHAGAALPHAVHESSFVDLVIIDPSTGFGNLDEKSPSSFTRALLREARCPVLLAPSSFERIDEAIFCYDGSASSIHAARLFTYVLPGLLGSKATILEVTRDATQLWDADHRGIVKWMRGYYPELNYVSLEGEPGSELFEMLFLQSNKIVVMGAYGRGWLSELFRPSTASRLIHTIDLPFFIAHL